MRPRRPAVRQRLRRGTYLLPSLFTIGNILLGFFAVVNGFQGNFQRAAVMIFVAAFLDGLDGRIARLTGTETAFGREFDSLADVITFGMAPALMAWLWGLHDLGRPGWLVPLLFLVCAAARLARFNVQTRIVDSRYFVGLPAPAAASTLASILFFAPEREWRAWVTALLVVMLVCLGALMVSTFRYWSFKRIDLRRRWSYRVAFPVAAILLAIATHPPAIFFAIGGVYSLSGPAVWAWGRLRHRARRASRPEGREAGS